MGKSGEGAMGMMDVFTPKKIFQHCENTIYPPYQTIYKFPTLNSAVYYNTN
jgi:hypothetical protein